ncbi:ABC transporter substrate-binding protein [Vibrio sp. S4M6]|uniref:ABC transporter substrate-binding protein n=1 Tax=Vibrio sinus TaxID=2946865 RepID=UPI00202A0709|nr:ABC transporter substrate-binding protein [Vibrio sinus]MCL9779985.1 ABC transporter substrate-binding protein [Vibrio sinus]
MGVVNQYVAKMPMWLAIVMALVSFPALSNQVDADQQTASPHVVFINPGSKEDPFYRLVDRFMRASAEDLGIHLEVIYGSRNHILSKNEALKVLLRDKLPDYIFLINIKKNMLDVIPRANQQGVKVFMFNGGLLAEDREKYGFPESKYPNWIAEYVPDEIQAGYILAKNLIDKALAEGLTDKDGTLYIAGIGGTRKTTSELRIEGLRRAVSEYPNVKIVKLAYGYWEKDKAKFIAEQVLKQTPKLSVIWNASDGMALGAAEAIVGMGKVPNKDVLVGGIDWAAVAVDEVNKGTLSSTVGGHFMDGGWGIVMVHDYHRGYPIQNVLGQSKFSMLTDDNVAEYIKYFGKGDFSGIDFKRFSKAHNPELRIYDFSLKNILNQLNSAQ